MKLRQFAERIAQSTQGRFNARQWLVGYSAINVDHYNGIKPRVVLSRRLCVFRSFDLSVTPARLRSDALKNKVQVHAPFDDVGFSVCWQGEGRAAVWMWDKAALIAKLPEAAKYPVIPESLLWLSPQHSGEQIPAMEGHETQVWQEGTLRESRYSYSDDAPQPDYRRSAPMQAEEIRWWSHVSAGGVAALMLMVLAIQLGGMLRITLDSIDQQEALNAGSEAVASQRFDRGLAQRQQAKVLAQKTHLASDSSAFFQRLITAMPESAEQWRELTLQPGALTMVVKDAAPDPRLYVERLERVVGLKSVAVEMDLTFGQVSLRAEIPSDGMRNLGVKEQ